VALAATFTLLAALYLYSAGDLRTADAGHDDAGRRDGATVRCGRDDGSKAGPTS